MPQYLSTDPNAGQPLDDGYVSTDPNAGQAREGESLRGFSAAESFFGPHRPIGEGATPESALDRLNAMLQGPAQPSSVGDVAGLMIPGAAPHFRVPLGNMIRETMDAGRQAASWKSVPGDVIERLYRWATTPAEAIQAERYANAPRLAGKAPTLNEALIEGLESARKGPAPTSVSLPGGGAIRPKPRYQDYVKAEASATPPGRSSGAPPAVAAPGSSRPAPPPAAQSLRLTAEESQALQELTAQGYDEAAVLREIASRRPGGRPASGKPALNAAEAKEYQRLLGRGMPPEQAMALIDQQRTFTKGKGLPTSEQARRSVVDRNTSGRWD